MLNVNNIVTHNRLVHLVRHAKQNIDLGESAVVMRDVVIENKCSRLILNTVRNFFNLVL